MSARLFKPQTSPDEPFNRFMFAILEVYNEEGMRDGRRLSAYANQLLDREPLPEIPAGVSPAQFAKDTVEKADQSPGINPSISLQWLMDALVAWHDCAEGYMWISNIVEGREHAALLVQPFYLLAIEGLRHRMGPVLPGAGAATPEESLMMAKSLVGLGESLATTGQVGEAAGRYVEALRWDSEDREGARPRLAIVLALQGECGSAATALAQAKVDVFSAYAAAVIGFAETEGTGAALDQLATANDLNPEVADIIAGRRKMKGMLTGNARYDEAQYAMLMLAPVVDGMPGFGAWVSRETRGTAGTKGKPRHARRR